MHLLNENIKKFAKSSKNIVYERFSGSSYRGVNALTDTVPETTGTQYWQGEWYVAPQKFRIQLSCAATISSVKIRNSFDGGYTTEA